MSFTDEGLHIESNMCTDIVLLKYTGNELKKQEDMRFHNFIYFAQTVQISWIFEEV